jgi:hypothetical protein
LSLIAFDAASRLAAPGNVLLVKFITSGCATMGPLGRRSTMPDDLPLDAPSHHSATPSEPSRVLEAWRLERGGHLLICELRNELVSIDVGTFEAKRSPLLFERCASHAHAQFTAMATAACTFEKGGRNGADVRYESSIATLGRAKPTVDFVLVSKVVLTESRLQVALLFRHDDRIRDHAQRQPFHDYTDAAEEESSTLERGEDLGFATQHARDRW